MSTDEQGREMEQGEEAIRKGQYPWQGGWRPPLPRALPLGAVDTTRPKPFERLG